MTVSTAPVMDEMVTRIVDEFAPAAVILFGSRARGDARPDSDYDLLVVVDRCPDRRAAAVAMRAALADLPASKDIVVATVAEVADQAVIGRGIVGVALREGQSLYARG